MSSALAMNTAIATARSSGVTVTGWSTRATAGMYLASATGFYGELASSIGRTEDEAIQRLSAKVVDLALGAWRAAG